MEKEAESLEEQIERVVQKFSEKSKNLDIQVVSHFDTDGITSAAIMIQTLKKLDKSFTLKIVKSLDEKTISKLSKDKLVLFIDLASNSLHHIIKHGLKNVFIIDHHQIIQNIPDDISMINPELNGRQKIIG